MAEKPKASKTAQSKTKSTAGKSPAAKATVPKRAAPKAARVKLPRGAAAPSRAASKSAPPQTEAFYVSLEPGSVRIHSAPVVSAGSAGEFQSFADARERAIDGLIESIEESERRLHLLRRVSTFEEYQRGHA